jgi:hypothetical protein
MGAQTYQNKPRQPAHTTRHTDIDFQVPLTNTPANIIRHPLLLDVVKGVDIRNGGSCGGVDGCIDPVDTAGTVAGAKLQEASNHKARV